MLDTYWSVLIGVALPILLVSVNHQNDFTSSQKALLTDRHAGFISTVMLALDQLSKIPTNNFTTETFERKQDANKIHLEETEKHPPYPSFQLNQH